jgi:hypothetical protein
MEVGPQGAASTPPTSSALVAAPLATENKVEIGNATACAAVVATVVEQLGTAGGLAAFGDLKALEKALAAKDKTHVLGQQLLSVAQKAKKDAAKDTPRFTFDQNEAFPLASARQQIVRAFTSPDDATRQKLGKVVEVLVTAVMGGANYNLCDRLKKSYCVRGMQLLHPLNIKNDWGPIISAAVVAVAFAIQNHLAAPDPDRVAKQHQVLAILCRCGGNRKSVLPTALRTPLVSSVLEALERRGALTKEVSSSPGEFFKPLLAEAFNMRTPDEISDKRFEVAAWVQALAAGHSLLDALEHGADRFKLKELQAVVDALGPYQRGKSDHIICKILTASKPYTVVEPRRVLDVLRDLAEGRDVAAARSAFDALEAGVAWVAVYVGDDDKVRIGVVIKFHGAFVLNHSVDRHAIDATSPRRPNALESLVDLRVGPDSHRSADPENGHPFV